MTSPPPTLTTILAATDLSPPARHAADRAARIARQAAASLTLLHVLPAGPLDDLREWLGAAAEKRLADDSRRELAALADELEATHGLAPQVGQKSGSVVDVLVDEANARNADLVVLGARGAGFLRRMVLGTTAERLLRRTPRPLLVVRQAPYEPYRRALVAVDFSPWSQAVVAQARRVAPQARPVLLTAFQVPFEDKLRFAGVEAATVERYRQQARVLATQQLHALADAAGLLPGTWEACVVEGDASMRVVEQEQVLDCDLVVLGKHGQSAAEDLLLGSVTKHVLAEGRADVLVATRPELG